MTDLLHAKSKIRFNLSSLVCFIKQHSSVQALPTRAFKSILGQLVVCMTRKHNIMPACIEVLLIRVATVANKKALFVTPRILLVMLVDHAHQFQAH